jgi:hypothetical protein
MAEKCQILLYTSYLHIIGGIETFVINFTKLLGAQYDMILMSSQVLPEDIKAQIPVRILQGVKDVECDTLIMIRAADANVPSYIKYNRMIRMCHSCRTNTDWSIPNDYDELVHVSEVSKKSFETDGLVIHNPLIREESRPLFLVSATRIPARDKGINSDRLVILAKMLEKAEIPYIWINFSDRPLENGPKHLINVGHIQNVQPYIAKADYLVQLSDHEGFGYTVLEALINGTAVICTPFETTEELGVVDGENGYIVPFDLNFDVRKLLDVPQFSYEWDNAKILKQWKKLLGKPKKPKPAAKEEQKPKVMVRVKRRYFDLELDKYLYPDEVYTFTEERALTVAERGFIEVMDGVR